MKRLLWYGIFTLTFLLSINKYDNGRTFSYDPDVLCIVSIKGVVKFCHPFIYLKPVPNVHITAHFVTLAKSWLRITGWKGYRIWNQNKTHWFNNSTNHFLGILSYKLSFYLNCLTNCTEKITTERLNYNFQFHHRQNDWLAICRLSKVLSQPTTSSILLWVPSTVTQASSKKSGRLHYPLYLKVSVFHLLIEFCFHFVYRINLVNLILKMMYIFLFFVVIYVADMRLVNKSCNLARVFFSRTFSKLFFCHQKIWEIPTFEFSLFWPRQRYLHVTPNWYFPLWHM